MEGHRCSSCLMRYAWLKIKNWNLRKFYVVFRMLVKLFLAVLLGWHPFILLLALRWDNCSWLASVFALTSEHTNLHEGSIDCIYCWVNVWIQSTSIPRVLPRVFVHFGGCVCVLFWGGGGKGFVATFLLNSAGMLSTDWVYVESWFSCSVGELPLSSALTSLSII